jgi:hypothetical protein
MTNMTTMTDRQTASCCRLPFRSRPAAAMVAAVTLLAGCWGQGFGVAEVTGTVTLDGKPRKGLMVVFAPNDGQATRLPPAYGFTNDEGRYRAIRPGSKPGAVVGPLTVKVLAFDGTELTVNGRPVPNTEIAKEIVRGANVVDIDLKTQ